MKSKSRHILTFILFFLAGFALALIASNYEYLYVRARHGDLLKGEYPFFQHRKLPAVSLEDSVELNYGMVGYTLPSHVARLKENDPLMADYRHAYRYEDFTLYFPLHFSEVNYYDESQSYFTLGKEMYNFGNPPKATPLLIFGGLRKAEYYTQLLDCLNLRMRINAIYQYDTPSAKVIEILYSEEESIRLIVCEPQHFGNVGEVFITKTGDDPTTTSIKDVSHKIIANLKVNTELDTTKK